MQLLRFVAALKQRYAEKWLEVRRRYAAVVWAIRCKVRFEKRY